MITRMMDSSAMCVSARSITVKEFTYIIIKIICMEYGVHSTHAYLHNACMRDNKYYLRWNEIHFMNLLPIKLEPPDDIIPNKLERGISRKEVPN